MAQLSDDCFAEGGSLMTADQALALLGQTLVTVSQPEQVALRDGHGRILAADVIAARDVPPHDNAAVDGYAVFFADLDGDGETRLPVTGRTSAGHPLGRAARLGEAIRIFTGAPMPDGADTIMMQEDCRLEGNAKEPVVVIRPGIRRGANRRRAGEDVTAGTTVLRRGQRLRPQDVGLAASLGLTRLKVYRRLRVALMSTGDELRNPGARLPAGCIYDSNRVTLHGALEGLGCTVTDLGIVADRRLAIRQALAHAAEDHDLIMSSGGVSVGEEDHVKVAVEELGSLHFWRLAIKPGRPVAMGQVGRVPFVGLPGNPVAVMVTFLKFARPLILGLAGCTDFEPVLFRVRAGFAHKKKLNRREFVRARLVAAADGSLVADKFPRDGAGILTSLVESDGLVELPEEVTELAKGSMVDFLPFNEVWR
ncbi:MAG: gephyrin-like molybdotransferase Glp [Kiloniellales bacterium]